MHRCPDCPKTFPSPSKLKRHHLIHSGQKPFSCGSCGKAFNQSHHLKLHLQNVHRSRPPAGAPPVVTPTNRQRPSCDKPAGGASTRVGGNWAEIPSAVTSSVGSQPWWRSTSVCLPVSETGNQFETTSRGTEVTATVSRDADPVDRDQAHSADVSASACEGHKRHTCKVCLRSFRSSLQLWIHLPTHHESKPPGRGQSIFKKGPWKMNFQPRESRSATKRTMSLRHQCPKCLKGFCSPSKLKRHFLIHTDQKPYSCSVCWKGFRQKGHLKTHLGAENKCPLSAADARLRLSHDSRTSRLQPETQLRRPSGDRDSSVELKLQCEIRVNSLHELNTTEIKLNSFVKPERTLSPSFQCHESAGQGSQHVTRKDVKRFRCLICSRSFRLEVNLIRHGRVHWNQRELGTSLQNCNNVTMSISDAIKPAPEPDPADLADFNVIVKPEIDRENLRDSFPLEASSVPPAEQPRATFQQRRLNPSHQCRSCSKCFPCPSKLKRHMMIHTGQRPFSCEVCGKRFRQKTHLRVHCRTHLLSRYQKQRALYVNRPPSRTGGFHARPAADVPIQEVFRQNKCNETLAGCDVISAKHPVQTPSTATVRDDVKTEAGIRSFPQTSKKREVVPLITAPGVNETRTAQAVQIHGGPRHECSRCLKCFPSPSKLKRHEMVHTGLKPFRCPTCGKAFRQRTHLKTHEGGHCTRKPSQPVNQQAGVKRLKMNKQQQQQQQQLYPMISVCVPSLQHTVNTDTQLVSRGVTSRDKSVQDCTGPELPHAKVTGPFKTNAESTPCKKKTLHTCRICCKNFSSPYKLSRHLLTHSGVRPYKCSFCSKALTQHGHLKLHERSCRQRSRISDCSHRDIMNTNHLQDKPVENLIYSDFNLDAVTEQRESSYSPTSVSSFTAGDLAYCPEAIDTDWLAGPETGSQENYESGEKVDQAADSCNQASDQFSYSFPSELAFEISKLIQNQSITAAPPLSQQHEGNTINVETPGQREGGAADSPKNKVLGDVRSVNLLRTDSPRGDWRDPVIVFECGECATNFMSDHFLKQHLCPARVRPEGKKAAARNRCDVCFKHFASPSKLVRHSLVHTGQRPFNCDVCGKTFTQRSHVTTHRQTH